MDSPQNGFHDWLSQYIKPLDRKRRKEIIENIRQAASPGFDYFFFVVLSGAIATLGLPLAKGVFRILI